LNGAFSLPVTRGRFDSPPKVVKQVHRRSGGVPRIINKISDLALTAAYTTNSLIVQSVHFRVACSELIESRDQWPRIGSVWRRRLRLVLIAAVAILVVIAAGYGSRVYFHPKLFTRQDLETLANPSSFAKAFIPFQGSFASHVAPEGTLSSTGTLELQAPTIKPERSAESGQPAVAPGDSS
jgi:hypothetical protein